MESDLHKRGNFIKQYQHYLEHNPSSWEIRTHNHLG